MASNKSSKGIFIFYVSWGIPQKISFTESIFRITMRDDFIRGALVFSASIVFNMEGWIVGIPNLLMLVLLFTMKKKYEAVPNGR
jgi:hypothetical protein